MRSFRISLTRFARSAFVARFRAFAFTAVRDRFGLRLGFILPGLSINPSGVPIVQTWIVDCGHVLDVLVSAQVGAALEYQPLAVGERETSNFRVASGRC